MDVVIILVASQMGENIGAAARAMANFGLSCLRLVAPRDGWPNPAAETMSSGAFAYMEPVEVFDDLSGALADVQFAYATSARPRGMVKPVATPQEAAQATLDKTQAGQRVAFVFGAERTGLENDDVARCHSLLQVPTAPDFASLNLGQCVLLVAYALFSAKLEAAGDISFDVEPPAPQADFDNLFDRLEIALDEGGFFKEPNLRPTVVRSIRNMLLRAGFTAQEVKTFHGVMSALKRAKP